MAFLCTFTFELGKRDLWIPALYFWRSCLWYKHKNRRNWNTEYMCDIVIACSECHSQSLNHYIWLMPVIDNNLSVSWKSPDYRVWLCLLPLVSPKPAGWTCLHVPLHAASQFNLLSSTNWTALLWKQFSAPPLLGLGVNIPDKIFGSQSVIFFWSSVLACFSITAFPKCFVSLLVMAAVGHSSRLWYELPSWSGILQQSAFLKADWCCLNPFWVGVMHPTGCLALLMKCWIQSL